MPPNPKAIIAGGGIAGLAAAIALALRGIASVILERQETFSPAGAGIQIGPNGTLCLAALGVMPHLQAASAEPEAIIVRGANSGNVIAELPLGPWTKARHGSTYVVAHRADLHAALLARVNELPAIQLVRGFEIVDVAQSPTSVEVYSKAGSAARGDVLIAADGVWSSVRDTVFGRGFVDFANTVAHRVVVPRTSAPAPLQELKVGLWLGANVHAVHYPIRGGADLAIVLVQKASAQHARTYMPNNDSAADSADVTQAASRLVPELRTFVQSLAWRSWPIYRGVHQPHWTSARVVMIGDAAHPIVPYLAQGGVMAIEDAVTLSAAIHNGRSDIPSALAQWEGSRRARVKRIVAAAENNGRIYHMSGPLALARNATMRAVGGKRLMARLDWLYGWKPPASG